MAGHWVLAGRTPVIEPDVLKWARWFETADRRVAFTEVPGGVVSTVFLGLDHNFGDGPPLLFETMSFLDGESEECVRTSAWSEAEAAHRAMVARGGRA
jgi:hypothetical protein